MALAWKPTEQSLGKSQARNHGSKRSWPTGISAHVPGRRLGCCGCNGVSTWPVSWHFSIIRLAGSGGHWRKATERAALLQVQSARMLVEPNTDSGRIAGWHGGGVQAGCAPGGSACSLRTADGCYRLVEFSSAKGADTGFSATADSVGCTSG